MPSKNTRASKKRDASSTSHKVADSDASADKLSTEPIYKNECAMDLIQSIIRRNKDPEINKMLAVLADKVSADFKEQLEEDKRSRSVVVSGLPESGNGTHATESLEDLESKVHDILDALSVRCRPMDIYRMGKPDSARPRLVRIVFPSTFYWRRALANARLLRDAGFPQVYVRRGMTSDEREREYELRQLARERNKGLSQREWVVYRGELTRVSEINRRKSGNA
ncbi:hypothetical protein Y032_0100g3318 [Ancylostoma ceylanicum]|uniref:Uncharacterized protein n=1 Tax=Ancylostoma ceylanicum TaxID=53326 RepID=A0A016TIC5_9BILA|nr:hypothetical protein Y032_0100g3318 [Ancylostoma ceylanicum]